MAIHRVRFNNLILIGLASGLIALLVGTASVDRVRAGHGAFTISDGTYRVPYADGLTVTAFNDHHNHPAVKNRVDMGSGQGTTIVADASGVIRAIVDFNGNAPGAGDGIGSLGGAQNDALEHSCLDSNTVEGSCSDYNNYVWIEHFNGEWTKYTHFGTGTVSANNWSVGDFIMAGEALGEERDVGSASGTHLHHEVAVPNDPNDSTPFSTLGGFIQGTNVVAFVCFIDGDTNGDNLYTDGEIYTAGPCPDIVGGATSFLTGGADRSPAIQWFLAAAAVAVIAAGGWYTRRRWLSKETG